jgi:hypothetical protein
MVAVRPAIYCRLAASPAHPSASPHLRVQALDRERIDSGNRHRAECRAQRTAEVPGVLVLRLDLNVEIVQPPISCVAERDPAAGRPEGVLLGQEPG